MPPFFEPAMSGGIALLICLCVTPVIIKLATRKGWVVAPRQDRWHQKPVALMGGIGIFLSFSAAVLYRNISFIHIEIYGAMLLLFCIGLIDDIREVKPV